MGSNSYRKITWRHPRSMVCSVVLAGCGVSPSPEMLPPPQLAETLEVRLPERLAVGGSYEVQVGGAQPGTVLRLAWSRSAQMGSACPGPLRGACLDLDAPAQPAVQGVVGPSGRVRAVFRVPPNAPLQVYLQALGRDRSGALAKSPLLVRTTDHVLAELCEDGIDNDGDGLTDCEAATCLSRPVCMEQICDDGADDDLDGTVDCQDEDCWTQETCWPIVERTAGRMRMVQRNRRQPTVCSRQSYPSSSSAYTAPSLSQTLWDEVVVEVRDLAGTLSRPGVSSSCTWTVSRVSFEQGSPLYGYPAIHGGYSRDTYGFVYPPMRTGFTLEPGCQLAVDSEFLPWFLMRREDIRFGRLPSRPLRAWDASRRDRSRPTSASYIIPIFVGPSRLTLAYQGVPSTSYFATSTTGPFTDAIPSRRGTRTNYCRWLERRQTWTWTGPLNVP